MLLLLPAEEMVCCWNLHWSRLAWHAQWKWQSRTRPRVATFFQLLLLIPSPTSSNHTAAVAPASHTHQNVCNWVSPVILRLHWSQGKNCSHCRVCMLYDHPLGGEENWEFCESFPRQKKISLFVASSSSSSPTKDSGAVKSWWCLQWIEIHEGIMS